MTRLRAMKVVLNLKLVYCDLFHDALDILISVYINCSGRA